MTAMGFVMKRYEIYSSPEQPAPSSSSWRRILDEALSEGASEGDDGAGFAIYHAARDSDYVLASTWYGGHMLRHRLFRYESSCVPDAPCLVSMADTKLVACVWEMKLLCFEGQCWITYAMDSQSSKGTIENYLRHYMTDGWV